jgi:hypothetical protein
LATASVPVTDPAPTILHHERLSHCLLQPLREEARIHRQSSPAANGTMIFTGRLGCLARAPPACDERHGDAGHLSMWNASWQFSPAQWRKSPLQSTSNRPCAVIRRNRLG